MWLLVMLPCNVGIDVVNCHIVISTIINHVYSIALLVMLEIIRLFYGTIDYHL